MKWIVTILFLTTSLYAFSQNSQSREEAEAADASRRILMKKQRMNSGPQIRQDRQEEMIKTENDPKMVDETQESQEESTEDVNDD